MRRLRFIAPLAAAGAFGLAAWVPTVTASASTPTLPPLTAQQVVAKALAANVAGLSGTVEWSANMGIPDLGSLVPSSGGSSFDPTTLLSGNHTIKVWDAGPSEQRLALPGTLSEQDFVHNGAQAWYYDSTTDTVTHYVGAASGPTRPATPAGATEAAQPPPLTPDQLAAKLLGQLSPSTTVRVVSPVYVAGRPTYLVALAPTPGSAGAAATTVDRVTVAVDARTGLPLQLAVYAKGQSAPALEVGFTSVSFAVPSASEFAPLTGGTVKTETIGAQSGTSGAAPSATVRLTPTGSPKHGGGLLGGGQHHRAAADGAGPAVPNNAFVATGPSAGPPVVSGPPWAQIVTVTESGAEGNGGPIDQATTVVTGTFGTGRLLQTSLLDALFLPDGHVLIGLVTPAALEAAAAAAAH